jgi:hypothetical protein
LTVRLYLTNIILITEDINLKITSNKYGQQLILIIIDATEEITFHAITEVTSPPMDIFLSQYHSPPIFTT